MNGTSRGCLVFFLIDMSIALLTDASLQREVSAHSRAMVRFAAGVCASLCYLACMPGSEPGGATWVVRQARSLCLLTQVPAETMEFCCKELACDHSACLITVNINGWQHSSVSDSKCGPRNGFYLAVLAQMLCFIRLVHVVSSSEYVFILGL